MTTKFFILLMVCQVGGLPYMAIIILSRLASWLLLHSSMHPSRTNVDWCLLLIVFSSPPTISVNGHDPYPSCPTGQRLMTTIYNMTKTTTTTTTTKKKKMSDVDCFASLRLLWMARSSIVEWGVGSTYDISLDFCGWGRVAIVGEGLASFYSTLIRGNSFILWEMICPSILEE